MTSKQGESAGSVRLVVAAVVLSTVLLVTLVILVSRGKAPPTSATKTTPPTTKTKIVIDEQVQLYRQKLDEALSHGASSAELNRMVAQVRQAKLSPRERTEADRFERQARDLFRKRDETLSAAAQKWSADVRVLLGRPRGWRHAKAGTPARPIPTRDVDEFKRTFTRVQDSWTRRNLIEGLDPNQPGALPVLFAVAQDPRFTDWYYRSGAVAPLARLQGESLRIGLASSRSLIREMISLALARAGDKGRLSWIHARLTDKWHVRATAARALCTAGTVASVKPLTEALEREEHPLVKRHLRRALGRTPRRDSHRFVIRGTRFDVRCGPSPKSPSGLPLLVLGAYGFETEYLEAHLFDLEQDRRVLYVALPAVDDFVDPPLKPTSGLPVPHYPVQRAVEAFEQLVMVFQARGLLDLQFAILADGLSCWVALGYAARNQRVLERLVLMGVSPNHAAMREGLLRIQKTGRMRSDIELERYGRAREFVQGRFRHEPTSDAERWALDRKGFTARFGDPRNLEIGDLYGPVEGLSKVAPSGKRYWVARYRRPVQGCFVPAFALPRVRTPTFVITGKYLVEKSPEDARAVARTSENGQVVDFKRSGELAVIEEGNKVIPLLRKWLAKR